MYAFFITYTIASFLIYLVKSQELAVTYMVMYMSETRKVYSYRDVMYATKLQMVKQVIEDHKDINRNNLLLCKISLLGNSKIILNENPKYKKFVSHSYSFKEVKPSKYLVTEFYVKGKLIYQCNHKDFTSYHDACIYVRNNNRPKSPSITRRPSLTPPPSPINPQLEGIKIYCSKFWKNLWNNCDYSCYSTNNFYVMKEKFLREMNYYRVKHGSGLLMENQRLSDMALRILQHLLSIKKGFGIEENENVAKANIKFAPLIINQWYGEQKYYNYKSNSVNFKTRHFVAMIWKGAKNVGIAIVKSGDMIYLKVLFDVSSYKSSSLRSNVLRKVSIRSKH